MSGVAADDPEHVEAAQGVEGEEAPGRTGVTPARSRLPTVVVARNKGIPESRSL